MRETGPTRRLQKLLEHLGASTGVGGVGLVAQMTSAATSSFFSHVEQARAGCAGSGMFGNTGSST